MAKHETSEDPMTLGEQFADRVLDTLRDHAAASGFKIDRAVLVVDFREMPDGSTPRVCAAKLRRGDSPKMILATLLDHAKATSKALGVELTIEAEEYMPPMNGPLL